MDATAAHVDDLLWHAISRVPMGLYAQPVAEFSAIRKPCFARGYFRELQFSCGISPAGRIRSAFRRGLVYGTPATYMKWRLYGKCTTNGLGGGKSQRRWRGESGFRERHYGRCCSTRRRPPLLHRIHDSIGLIAAGEVARSKAMLGKHPARVISALSDSAADPYFSVARQFTHPCS